jgi:hypothetical protein
MKIELSFFCKFIEKEVFSFINDIFLFFQLFIVFILKFLKKEDVKFWDVLLVKFGNNNFFDFGFNFNLRLDNIFIFNNRNKLIKFYIIIFCWNNIF